MTRVSPRSTCNETWSSTTLSPYVLTRSSTRTIGPSRGTASALAESCGTLGIRASRVPQVALRPHEQCGARPCRGKRRYGGCSRRGTMRTPMGLAAFAATVIGACAAPPPPASPPIATTTAASDARAPRAPATANDAQTKTAPAVVEGPPPPAPRCRLTVTDAQGCQPNQVEELVAPARSRIEHCRGASGGKLTVRVRREPGGKLAFDAAPGTSLESDREEVRAGCAQQPLQRGRFHDDAMDRR